MLVIDPPRPGRAASSGGRFPPPGAGPHVDSNPTTSYAYQYEGTPTVDVGFIKTGFVPFYIRNLALTAVNSSIPVAMTADRNFI